MRRLTVVQLLPALENGGVERSTVEIAQALARSGHRALVVSAGGRMVEALLAAGAEHIALDIGRKSPTTLRHLRSLGRVFDELRPDIVHARSRLPAWLARWALRSRPGPKFVTTAHGLYSPGRYSGIMTRGERVICVSSTVRDHLLAHWPRTDPDRLVVIERGIEPAHFTADPAMIPGWRRQLAQQYPALAEGPMLLLPGRGTRLKGHAEAIELLAALRNQGVPACLWMPGAREAGREAYVAELERLARARGVAGHLAITAAESDMARIYAVSNVVLQLSAKPEAFGRTVLEALAARRPVVGWAHGGVGELLARYFPGGAVALGDAAGLVEATSAALAGRPPVGASVLPSLASMQPQTLKVYESLLD
jgi:glycosyltransferase involved in cell wall biosynthesis